MPRLPPIPRRPLGTVDLGTRTRVPTGGTAPGTPRRPTSGTRREPPTPPVTRDEAAVALRRAAEAQLATRRHIAEQKLNRARSLKQEIAADLYELAEILRDFHDQQLWRLIQLRSADGGTKDPYESWEQFLEREELASRSFADELINVVRIFPREVALETGMSRCYAIIMLARATPEEDTPNELLDAHPELRDLSVREIEERARRVREGIGDAGDVPTPASDLVRNLAVELQALLRNRGADGAKVKPKARAGDWWLVIELLASDASALRSQV